MANLSLFTKERGFWDVGSHHGVDTLVMHSLVKGASVVSFEPEPESCSEFRSIRNYNLKNNIKTNTLLVEAGLSDKWGNLRIY